MKLTTNIITSILCLFLGLQLTQAQCDGTNDIIQSDDGRNYTLNIANGFLSIGNSFTATCSGPIDGISFWTGEIPGTIGGVSITVELYRNPFSNSRVLLASLTNDIAFSNSTTPRENYFEFDNDPQLVSGTLYGFRIVINDNNQTMQVKLNSPSNPNPYTGGRQFTNNFEQTLFAEDQDLRFQIHYEDNVAPIANCRNITRTLGANGTVNITPNNINNGATDADSGVASLTLSQSSFDCSNIGDNTVTLSVFDQNGNLDTCQAIVTIVDETPPVLTCPDNITVFTVPGTPTVVNYADIIYEDCTVAAPNGFTFLAARNGKSYFLSQTPQPAPIAYTFSQVLGGHLATIENEEDNDIIRSAASAIINTDPILIGYNDIVSEGNFVWHSGSNSTYTNWAVGQPNNLNNVDYTEIGADGKWSVTGTAFDSRYFVLELSQENNITQTSGLPSGATFPVGITTNTFEATNAFGHTATCSFTVEVVENFKKIHVNAAAATNL